MSWIAASAFEALGFKISVVLMGCALGEVRRTRRQRGVLSHGERVALVDGGWCQGDAASTLYKLESGRGGSSGLQSSPASEGGGYVFLGELGVGKQQRVSGARLGASR